MPTIYVSINNRREASQVARQSIVRENNDYIVQFEFAESSGFTEAGLKSALFVTSRGMQERYFVGNSCVAPMFTKEDGNYLRVGVVEGEIRTTTSAYISIVDSVISGHEQDLDAPLPTTPLVDTLNPSDRVKVFIPSTGAVGAATIEQIRDGAGGGSDGHSPYIGENGNWFEYNDSTGEYVDTEVHAQGEQGEQGVPGADGAAGQTGPTGTTFTPSVSNEGVLSWTNDGDKQNPSPVSIKGPQGEPGVTPAAYTSNPEMNGTASAGSSTAYARGDHVHPTDTSRLATNGNGNDITVERNATEAFFTDIPTEPITLQRLLAKLANWYTVIAAAVPNQYTGVIGVSQWTLSGTTYSYDVTLTGLTATSTVIIEFSDKETEFSMSQSSNTLTISTETLPSADVAIKVLWYKGA